MTYEVYTDGAYSHNRKQGGCAFVILNEGNQVAKYSTYFINCTNITMEVMACILALEAIKVPSNINLYTDSMYVIGCCTLGWNRKKNKSLLKRLDKAIAFHLNVNFHHVKGHEDNEYNNLCDKLAVESTQIKLYG